MAQDPGERFHVFVSHKHDDHAIAMTVKAQLEGLSPRIECFVSGADISAGTDWNAEIRAMLVKSHLLVLIFTEPSTNWDWCLYEAGLFTSLAMTEDQSVVCLFRPQAGSPRPLANLQGVPAQVESVKRFLSGLCKETWLIAQDWRLGALAPDVSDRRIALAAAAIVNDFPMGRFGDVTYHPCHRIVLDLGASENLAAGIPDDAVVVEGPDATSSYTLSLFRLAQGQRARRWSDLVAATEDTGWRADLDRRFVAALDEQLFPPTTAALRLWDPWQRHHRSYRPVLYEVVREGSLRAPGTDGGPGGRPLGVTIVLDPEPKDAD